MDELYRQNPETQINSTQKTLIFISYLMLCVFGVLYFLESLYGLDQSIIPRLRFGSAIVALLASIAGGRIQIKVNLYFLWTFAIVGISFFSNIYTIGYNAIDVSTNILKTAIIAIAFYSTLKNTICLRQFLFMLTCVGAILFLVLSTNQLLHIDNRLGTTLTSGNTNTFAEYIMATIIAGFFISVLTKSKIIKTLAYIMIALEFYMLLLSGGRKFIIFLALMIAVFAWNKMKTISVSKKILLFVGVVIGFLLIWNLMMSNEILYNSIGRRFEANSREAGASDRFALIMNGLRFFVKSPIWGYGENAYSFLNGMSFGDLRYSHNNYIELLVNFGIIGFLVYYIPYFKIIASLKRKLKIAKQNYDLLLLFYSFMIASLFFHTGTIAYRDSTFMVLFVVISFKLVENDSNMS